MCIEFVPRVQFVYRLQLRSQFPEAVVTHASRHQNGSIHASSVFNGDDDGDLRNWFTQNLVAVTAWECPHSVDVVPMDAKRTFREYIRPIKALGLKVWDIQSDQRATGYLNLTDSDGTRIDLAGRADFLITPETSTLADYLVRIKFVIEIQSGDNIDYCEYQMKLYLLILMNTRGLDVLHGFLVRNDGNCRAYQARRSADGGCIYEENDIFHIYHIVHVITALLE